MLGAATCDFSQFRSKNVAQGSLHSIDTTEPHTISGHSSWFVLKQPTSGLTWLPQGSKILNISTQLTDRPSTKPALCPPPPSLSRPGRQHPSWPIILARGKIGGAALSAASLHVLMRTCCQPLSLSSSLLPTPRGSPRDGAAGERRTGEWRKESGRALNSHAQSTSCAEWTRGEEPRPAGAPTAERPDGNLLLCLRSSASPLLRIVSGEAHDAAEAAAAP